MAQEYDVTLKRVLERSHAFTTAVLGGSLIEKWLNVELPMVRNTRVDLVGETSGGQLFQFEIQSTNDPSMALRKAEYWVQLYRKFRRAPRQIVLYFGDETLRMQRELNEGIMGFSYTLINVRQMDGDALVAAEAVGDNMIGILARLRDPEGSARAVVRKVAALPPGERETVKVELLILSVLRRQMREYIRREMTNMPILGDIRNDPIFAPMFKQVEEESRQEGERALLRKQMERRFGAIPDWVHARLASAPPEELEAIGIRLLDATSLDELLD